ncbi:MAG: hypothetical protein QM644_01530 [Mobilitalea sp.]
MNSCELVSMITAVAITIAKSVPPDELTLITAVFGELASTLSTIRIKEALIQEAKEPDTDLNQEQELELEPDIDPDIEPIIFPRPAPGTFPVR